MDLTRGHCSERGLDPMTGVLVRERPEAEGRPRDVGTQGDRDREETERQREIHRDTQRQRDRAERQRQRLREIETGTER